MIPSVGRIVHYRLNESDVTAIQAGRRARGVGEGIGNPVRPGTVYPLIVACVWGDTPTEQTGVNGQVVLDGPDTLWVTSRQQGTEPGQWSDPRATPGSPAA